MLILMSHFTALPYRIAIFPAKKTVVSSIPTNIWFILSGSFGETKRIYMPKQNLEFIFHVGITKIVFLTILEN